MSRVPLVWALVYVVLLGVVFFKVSWPLSDTYAHLVKPAMLSWREAIVDAFGRGVEYRPLFTIGIKATYEAVGAWLQFYQALVLLQFAALLTLVVVLCRPIGSRRALAACIAISCVCGLHTTRILFGFWPLNHHSAVMVSVLLMIALAFYPRTRPIDWVFGPLALVAMLGLESGVLIIPLSVVLWWFRAPGIGLRGVSSVIAAAAVYLTIRLTFSEHAGGELSVYADSGFIFQAVDANTLKSRFGNAPYIFWAYNVVATFLTVLFSEPREGIYSFVESILARDMETWQWFHVGSSVVTTTAILGGLAWGRPWKERDRLLVVAGCALLVFGSALGFLYTRDRIGLAGGIGYALLLYVACATLLEQASAPRWRRQLVTGVVTIVAVLWVVRSGELWFQLRDTAWDYHGEWTERFEELGGAQRSTDLLREMQATVMSRTPVDPRLDPAWTYALFERRFHRLPQAP